MATFLYICKTNDEEFETEHSVKVELEECPICKDKGLEQHKPYRLIAGSTIGRVQLTGHELTAKTKEDINKMREKARTDSNFMANIVGESTFNNMVK